MHRKPRDRVRQSAICIVALAAVSAMPIQAIGQSNVPPRPTEERRGELPQPSSLGQGIIVEIRIEGTERVDPVTVRSYLTVSPGDPFESDRLDQSLKQLFTSGLFEDVTVQRDGSTLIVKVTENPLLNQVVFEGNQRISTDQLTNETQLRPRQVYTRTRVQSDVQRIQDLYRRNGRFAATVEPKIIRLDQNRVNLVFEINEGTKTGINRIIFIGNNQFSDGTLGENILTRETAWWRFLSSSDSYDPDRLTVDRELLRRFYMSRGYADFRVLSAVAELAPDQSGFFITFTIDEGERYRFGKVEVASSIKNLSSGELTALLTTKTDSWYDTSEIEKSVSQITNRLSDLQYASADVKPRINRNRENLTIDIIYEVNEGPKIFVERINVTGNQRTIDRVIRREFDLSEGDPFSATLLRRSEQRVRDLGFFERVTVTRTDGLQPDQTIINVDVAERATGEISFGVGYSTSDGPLGEIGIRERNWLGKGQDVRLGFSLSSRGTQADISFTEPYFFERNLSAGFDLFRRTRDYRDVSAYTEENLGGSLRLGYPISENLRQRLYYSAIDTTISGVLSTASRFIREQQGQRVTSLIGQELTYDRRNSRLDPTSGYFIRLATDLAGLGGDARFVRGRLGAGWFYPVAENWVTSVTGEVGQVIGLGEGVAISDRFFLGADTLRGFRRAGVGPRDLTGGISDALGGNRFYRASIELTFPVGLPRELGVKGAIFSDIGSLWEVDAVPRAGENFVNATTPRVSIGIGVSWVSPLGPIRIDVAQAIVKESYDQTELFRFSFGSRF